MSDAQCQLRATRVVIEMTEGACRTPQEVMCSPLIARLVAQFLCHLERRSSPLLRLAHCAAPEAEGGGRARAAERIADLLALLVHTPRSIAANLLPGMAPMLEERELLAEFVERLYDYWRTRERYLVFQARAESSRDRALQGHTAFIEAHERLKDLVLEVYRRIEANIRGHWPRVYRQVPAGTNMGLLIEPIPWPCPPGPYDVLREIRMVRLALLEPPVVLYPRRNFRQGRFAEVHENPLRGVQLNPRDWFCLPARVGPLIAFIFFHADYLALGVSLVNLFELAGHAEARRKPDAILVFGLPADALGEQQTVFYEDRDSDILLGAIGHSEEVDYFGYFKKMTLTLHNLIMMRRNRLPFHGAMCRIELKSGASANVVIVGDSAAGKSETLEAFRMLSDEHLRSFTIIADDMGSLEIASDGAIRGYGTEVGAFVRLDDISPEYTFGQIDRSILMNPHKTNARLVIPVTSFEHVIAGYPVDLLLYANNYEQVDESHPPLEMFGSVDSALRVFAEGYRSAKGTSDESGLVRTYFGNPFGPAQRRELHDALAARYFRAMFEKGTPVGHLRTRLGIPGFEQKGPEAAARALFECVAETTQNLTSA